jgi:hypothetical protein
MVCSTVDFTFTFSSNFTNLQLFSGIIWKSPEAGFTQIGKEVGKVHLLP